MAFDINGTFTRNYDFETDRTNGIKIMAARVDGEFDNFSTGMNQTFLRTGEAPMAANLRMGGFRLSNLGDGSLANPAVAFNNDATSGLYRIGLNNLGMAIAGVKRQEWNATGSNIVGAVGITGNVAITGNLTVSGTVPGPAAPLTLAGAGTPLTLNSTDSTSIKEIFQDAGVTRGSIASDATYCHRFRNSGGAECMRIVNANGAVEMPISTAGLTVNGALNVGNQVGAVLDTLVDYSNTNAYNVISFRSWSAGVPTTDATFTSWRGNGCIFDGNSSIYFRSAGTNKLTVNSAGVTASAPIFIDTSTGTPAISNNAVHWYNSTNGHIISGQGASYDILLVNRLGTGKFGVNTGGEAELLGTPIAPTPATGDNSTKIATTAFVKAQAYATLASPALTGVPTAPTASTSDNSTQLATTAFVKAQAYAPLASPTFTGTLNYTASIGGGTQTVEVGFRDIFSQSKTSNYSIVLNDRSTLINITTGGVAIPANATIAFPVGSAISVYNDSGSSQNITITTDTLRLAGTATVGTRALAQRGFATLVKVKTTEWIASGPGVT